MTLTLTRPPLLTEEAEREAAASAPEISIVIPLYNEEESIPQLYAELTAAMDAYGRPYEVTARVMAALRCYVRLRSGMRDLWWCGCGAILGRRLRFRPGLTWRAGM
jgi:hypothetical protein